MWKGDNQGMKKTAPSGAKSGAISGAISVLAALALALGGVGSVRGQPAPGSGGGGPRPGSPSAPASPSAPGLPSPPSAPAAPAGSTSPSAAPISATTPVAVKLAAEPLRLPDVGLTVQYPEDAMVTTTQLAQQLAAQIVAKDQRWSILISTPRTSGEQIGVVQKSDLMYKDLLRAVMGMRKEGQKRVVNTMVTLLEPTNVKPGDPLPKRDPGLVIPGSPTPGDRFYAMVPTTDNNAFAIRGVAVFKPLPDQFVVFELTCGDAVFAEVKPLFELVVASSVFADPGKLAAARRDAVAAGKRLTANYNAAALMAVLPEGEQVFRLHTPAKTGAPEDSQEHGFRTMRFWRGKKSEVNPGEGARGDDPEGILLEIRAQLFNKVGSSIGDGKPAGERYQVIDTQARYFMLADRQEEVWTLRTGIREMIVGAIPGSGAKASKGGRTVTEVGARTGQSMSVALNETGRPSKTIQPTIAGEGYMSQLEMFLLPRLLIRTGMEVEVGYYTYRSDSESITLRRELAQRDPAHANAWLVTSILREGDTPQASIYKDDGDLLRTALPDGKVWERSSIEQLQGLYKKKNLVFSRE